MTTKFIVLTADPEGEMTPSVTTFNSLEAAKAAVHIDLTEVYKSMDVVLPTIAFEENHGVYTYMDDENVYKIYQIED